MSVDTSTPARAEPVSPAPAGGHPNQFALLKQRRFAPFFWTQFSGPANDNLFKFAFNLAWPLSETVARVPCLLCKWSIQNGHSALYK